MKSEINGVNQCRRGQESFEKYRSRGRTFIQYDFRTPARKLFSCVESTLELCREKRERWVKAETGGGEK